MGNTMELIDRLKDCQREALRIAEKLEGSNDRDGFLIFEGTFRDAWTALTAATVEIAAKDARIKELQDIVYGRALHRPDLTMNEVAEFGRTILPYLRDNLTPEEFLSAAHDTAVSLRRLELAPDKVPALKAEIAAFRAQLEARWRTDIDNAPMDGTAFLAYGRHPDPVRGDAARGVKPGDHWWAIALWDVWRETSGWVFAKDGTATWSGPIAWMHLPAPPGSEKGADDA